MTDTQSLSERLRDLLTAAMSPEWRLLIEEVADALDAKDAEIARLISERSNRYWEGRWRDVDALLAQAALTQTEEEFIRRILAKERAEVRDRRRDGQGGL